MAMVKDHCYHQLSMGLWFNSIQQRIHLNLSVVKKIEPVSITLAYSQFAICSQQILNWKYNRRILIYKKFFIQLTYL